MIAKGLVCSIGCTFHSYYTQLSSTKRVDIKFHLVLSAWWHRLDCKHSCAASLIQRCLKYSIHTNVCMGFHAYIGLAMPRAKTLRSSSVIFIHYFRLYFWELCKLKKICIAYYGLISLENNNYIPRYPNVTDKTVHAFTTVSIRNHIYDRPSQSIQSDSRQVGLCMTQTHKPIFTDVSVS